MAEADIQRYLKRVESQHYLKPKFMEFLTALLEKIDAVHGVAKDMPLLFYVRTAVGDQLDIVAKYVGIERMLPNVHIPGYDSGMDDDTFRIAVLAKIMQNNWNGTNEGFLEIWDNTLGDTYVIDYHDNQDMTIKIILHGTFEPIITELLVAGYIFPKPAGVGVNLEVIQELDTAPIYIGVAPEANAARIGINSGISERPISARASIGRGTAFCYNACRYAIKVQ